MRTAFQECASSKKIGAELAMQMHHPDTRDEQGAHIRFFVCVALKLSKRVPSYDETETAACE